MGSSDSTRGTESATFGTAVLVPHFVHVSRRVRTGRRDREEQKTRRPNLVRNCPGTGVSPIPTLLVTQYSTVGMSFDPSVSPTCRPGYVSTHGTVHNPPGSLVSPKESTEVSPRGLPVPTPVFPLGSINERTRVSPGEGRKGDSR